MGAAEPKTRVPLLYRTTQRIEVNCNAALAFTGNLSRIVSPAAHPRAYYYTLTKTHRNTTSQGDRHSLQHIFLTQRGDIGKCGRNSPVLCVNFCFYPQTKSTSRPHANSKLSF